MKRSGTGSAGWAALGLAAVVLVVGSACAAPAGRSVAQTQNRRGPTVHPVATATGSDRTRVRRRAASAPRAVPRPSHTIVVMMENHSYSDIIGNPQAPYLNSLAAHGALFTHSHAITHPSEPNYLALFSGSTHGVTSDSCPHTYRTRNLGSELIAAKDTFAGYAEGLPHTGYAGCYVGAYVRKHVPWVNFGDLPKSTDRPFSAFPKRFNALPTLSFVTPNLNHDMHDGTIRQADTWMKRRLGRYVAAAKRDGGLVVITWDEDDGSVPNRIPTIVVGADVRPGRYAERIDHYRLLRTLEAAYRLRALGKSADRKPITDIWNYPHG